MDSINDRIQVIINQYFKGNVSAFCRDTGVSQPTLNDIIGGRKNKPSAPTIEKILNAKTVKINSDWLMTGSGSMLNEGEKEEIDEEVTQRLLNILKIKRISLDELAKIAGIDVNSAKAIAEKRKPVKIHTINSIVRAYPDLSLQYLVQGMGAATEEENRLMGPPSKYNETYIDRLENEIKELKEENKALIQEIAVFRYRLSQEARKGEDE